MGASLSVGALLGELLSGDLEGYGEKGSGTPLLGNPKIC